MPLRCSRSFDHMRRFFCPSATTNRRRRPLSSARRLFSRHALFSATLTGHFFLFSQHRLRCKRLSCESLKASRRNERCFHSGKSLFLDLSELQSHGLFITRGVGCRVWNGFFLDFSLFTHSSHADSAPQFLVRLHQSIVCVC